MRPGAHRIGFKYTELDQSYWFRHGRRANTSQFITWGPIYENIIIPPGRGAKIQIKTKVIKKNKKLKKLDPTRSTPIQRTANDWEIPLWDNCRSYDPVLPVRKQVQENCRTFTDSDLPNLNDYKQPSVNRSIGLTNDSYVDPVTGMKFVFVKGGCFQMGDVLNDRHNKNEKPVHEVCLNDFYVGETEITQYQWLKIMGNNPSNIQNGCTYPVEKVSWLDAQEFIKKFNKKTGKMFRLPTEAEWEYAARSGGKRERFSGSNKAELVACFHDTCDSLRPQPVAQLQANHLGIYDMSGNVEEWCQDWYDKKYYQQSPLYNPAGPTVKKFRVIRGGYVGSSQEDVRTTYRTGYYPKYSSHIRGFRLVLSKVEK